MCTGEEKIKRTSAHSDNNQMSLFLQEDGNFVLYGWKPVWASDTSGSDVLRLCMQEDCNLVLYNKGGEAKWHSNSAKSKPNMCRLYVTNDGKLVINRESEEIWSSK